MRKQIGGFGEATNEQDVGITNCDVRVGVVGI
jgi:hypothetical protein